MARKGKGWAQLAFSSLTPTKVVLLISLLANAATISFFVYADSRHADASLARYGLNRLCGRDYSWQLSQLTTAQQKASFSVIDCGTNYRTGEDVTGQLNQIVDGVARTP